MLETTAIASVFAEQQEAIVCSLQRSLTWTLPRFLQHFGGEDAVIQAQGIDEASSEQVRALMKTRRVRQVRQLSPFRQDVAEGCMLSNHSDFISLPFY